MAAKFEIISLYRLKEIIAEELPTNLNQLAIDHNQIKHINLQVIENVNLSKIWISENPYKCDCNSKDLFRFAQKNLKLRIQDVDHVYLDCSNGARKIHEIPEYSEFCVETREMILAIALPLSLICLLVLIGAMLFLVYKQTILIWIYSKPKLRSLISTDSEDNLDKPFDVFIR